MAKKKGEKHILVASEVAAGYDAKHEPSRAAHVVAYVREDEFVFYLSRAALLRLYRQIGRALELPEPPGLPPRRPLAKSENI